MVSPPTGGGWMKPPTGCFIHSSSPLSGPVTDGFSTVTVAPRCSAASLPPKLLGTWDTICLRLGPFAYATFVHFDGARTHGSSAGPSHWSASHPPEALPFAFGKVEIHVGAVRNISSSERRWNEAIDPLSNRSDRPSAAVEGTAFRDTAEEHHTRRTTKKHLHTPSELESGPRIGRPALISSDGELRADVKRDSRQRTSSCSAPECLVGQTCPNTSQTCSLRCHPRNSSHR